MPDLKAARDAALAVLQQARALAVMLARMRNPYADGRVDAELPSQPSDRDLRKLKEVCAAAANAIPDSLLEELAGLTTPSGVRAGGSYFASAHELTVSIACAIKDHLDIILHDDESRFAPVADATAVAPRRRTSKAAKLALAKAAEVKPVPSYLQEVARRWSDDVVYYRQLLWDIAGMAKTVPVPRVRMLLDCELAQARRHRSLRAAVPTQRATAPAVDAKKAKRPNLNAFSPSSRATVFKLVRALSEYPQRFPNRPLKKTRVYDAAGLRGASQQRSVDVAVDLGLMTAAFAVTDAGREFIKDSKS